MNRPFFTVGNSTFSLPDFEKDDLVSSRGQYGYEKKERGEGDCRKDFRAEEIEKRSKEFI